MKKRFASRLEYRGWSWTYLGLTVSVGTDVKGMESDVHVPPGGGQDVQKKRKVNVGEEAVSLNLKSNH